MDIKKITIDYSSESNKFTVILNGESFSFTPNQYMEFVNQSIIAVNSIIAERFSNSLKNFLEEEKPKKKFFTKKDSILIANEVEQYFKENLIGG